MPDITSRVDNFSGASSAYLGRKWNLHLHRSHFPVPPLTSSQDFRQSWWVMAMEPEHLHGLYNGRLWWICLDGRKRCVRDIHYQVTRKTNAFDWSYRCIHGWTLTGKFNHHLRNLANNVSQRQCQSLRTITLYAAHPSSAGPRHILHSSSSSYSCHSDLRTIAFRWWCNGLSFGFYSDVIDVSNSQALGGRWTPSYGLIMMSHKPGVWKNWHSELRRKPQTSIWGFFWGWPYHAHGELFRPQKLEESGWFVALLSSNGNKC